MNGLKYLLLFVFVLGFGGVVVQFYSTIFEVVSILLILLFVSNSKSHVEKAGDNGVLYFAICSIISAIATSTSIFSYAGFFIRPILALLVIAAFSYNYREIENCLYKVLKVVMWLALANFIIVMAFKDVMPVLTAPTGYQVHTFGYIFNYHATATRFGIDFIRNEGLFWEPGVLVIFMNIFVYMILFEYNQKLSKAILPIIVIITTASTSGYLVLSFILLVYLLGRLKSGKHKLFVIILSVGLFAALFPIMQEEFMFKTTEGVSSTHKRYFDFVAPLELAKDHPFFGIGPDPVKYIHETRNMTVDFGEYVIDRDTGSSNLFSTLFAYYGIPMALLFLYSLYRQNIFKKRWLFFFIILVGLLSEPMAFCHLYFLFIMSGFAKEKVRLKQGAIDKDSINNQLLLSYDK